MCAPSAPAAPDYTAAAQAQGQANLAAARLTTQLNRPNQITPWGTQTWTQGGGTQGSGTQSAPGPKAFSLGGGYGGYGGGSTGSGASGSGGGYSQYGYGTGADAGYNPGDQWTSTITLAPEQQALLDSSNRISQSLANTGEENLGRVGAAQAQPFDTSALSPLNGAPSYRGSQTSVNNPNLQSSFNSPGVQSRIDTSGVQGLPSDLSGLQQKATDAAMARQNQQLGQQEESLKAQLANQGITPGSDAYNRAMQPLEQSRVDAANQAFLTGTQYENQLYNQGMQTNAQQFGQAQAQGQFGNQAAGQQYNQNLGAAQFGNEAAGQQFGQNLQAAQFGNQANLQDFNAGLAGNQFGNTARQQGIQEQSYLRSLPLNELNALRTGSQVQAPSFTQYNNGGQVQAAPLFAAAQAQGQAAQQAYLNQVGASNGMLGGLFGLGGSMLQGAGAAGGFGALFSDRRLKKNVKRIGTTLKGVPMYSYEYLWGERGIGVMADEAPAEAVSMHPSGFAMVDYSKV